MVNPNEVNWINTNKAFEMLICVIEDYSPILQMTISNSFHSKKQSNNLHDN